VPLAPVAAAPERPPQALAAGGDWQAMIAAMRLAGLPKQLAQHCELAELGEAEVRLRLPPAHKSLLGTRATQDKLQAELQAHLRRPVRLVIDLAAAEGETPAERSRNEKRERQEKAIAAIEGDPFVRDVMELFDAGIDESTIKPV
jgi:DNA polymerase-3 subunit gamma/tau